MMILPLEQQVAPLELCQRLRELGAPQETAGLWTQHDETPFDRVDASDDLLGAFDPRRLHRRRGGRDAE